MIYLSMEMLLYLLCATLLGVMLGWLIWGVRSKLRVAEARAQSDRLRQVMNRTIEADRAEMAKTIEAERSAAQALRDEAKRLVEAEREASRLAALEMQNAIDAEKAASAEARARVLQALEDEKMAVQEAQAEVLRARTEMDQALEAERAKISDIRAEATRRIEAERVAASRARAETGRVRAELRAALDDARRAAARTEAELARLTDARTPATAPADTILAGAATAVPQAAETIATPPPSPDVEPRSAASATRPACLYDHRPASVDDLTAITGIGPVIERALNRQGCYHFKQLAGFSAADIEWLTETIDAFPGRIERDRWVEQARRLHVEKYGHDDDTLVAAEAG